MTERWRTVWGGGSSWRVWHVLGGLLMLPFGLFVLGGIAVVVYVFLSKFPASFEAWTSTGTRGLLDGAPRLVGFIAGTLFGGVLLRFGATMGLEGLLGATRSTTGMVTERRTVTALNGRRRQAVVVDGKQFVVPRVVDNAVREGDTIRLEFGRFSGELLSLSVRDEA